VLPCIEIYALAASATKQVTSARDLAGRNFREDDEAAKIQLTYSTRSDINRVRLALGTLVVCIIQVCSEAASGRRCHDDNQFDPVQWRDGKPDG
jgi:hypothetical protein